MIRENISLKKYNTFGIDAKAKYFAEFNSITELTELLEGSKFKIHPALGGTKFNILILGGGSNILFSKDFDGLVLKNNIGGIKMIKEDEEYVYIKAGAGENWHALVMHCIDHNWAGMENLSLIPGNVGATPMQNIGAYGVEIKDIFYELEAFHPGEKELVKFNLKDCDFGYRESVFKRKFRNDFVIASVTYRLSKIPRFRLEYGAIKAELEKMAIKELTIRAIAQAVINIRNSKLPDPAVIGNAGSFFKNPAVPVVLFNELKNKFPGIIGYESPGGQVKLAAGWLIEQCGWKGYRRNDAGCHSKQALVLVNYGNAKGDEILSLSEDILQSVKEKFSIDLEREVNIV